MATAKGGMSFKVYDKDGWHIAWFNDVEHLIRSMLANPTNTYHRNNQ